MKLFALILFGTVIVTNALGQVLPDSLARANRVASVHTRYSGPGHIRRLQFYDEDGLCFFDALKRNDTVLYKTVFRYHKTDRYFLSVDSSRYGTWKKYTYPSADKDSIVLLSIFPQFTDTAIQVREYRDNRRFMVTRFYPSEGIDSTHTYYDEVGDVMKMKSFRGKTADSVMYQKVFVTNDVTINFHKTKTWKWHTIKLTRYNPKAKGYERKEIYVAGYATVVKNVFGRKGLIKKQTLKISPKEKPQITAMHPYTTYDANSTIVAKRITYRYRRR